MVLQDVPVMSNVVPAQDVVQTSLPVVVTPLSNNAASLGVTGATGATSGTAFGVDRSRGLGLGGGLGLRKDG